MTGVEAPGKSAVQSAALTSTLSGRPVSVDVPFWSGPRQLSQPRAVPARTSGLLRQQPAASNVSDPRRGKGFIVAFRSSQGAIRAQRAQARNSFFFLDVRDYSTPQGSLQR